jgi:hypothetical protein
MQLMPNCQKLVVSPVIASKSSHNSRGRSDWQWEVYSQAAMHSRIQVYGNMSDETRQRRDSIVFGVFICQHRIWVAILPDHLPGVWNQIGESLPILSQWQQMEAGQIVTAPRMFKCNSVHQP